MQNYFSELNLLCFTFLPRSHTPITSTTIFLIVSLHYFLLSESSDWTSTDEVSSYWLLSLNSIVFNFFYFIIFCLGVFCLDTFLYILLVCGTHGDQNTYQIFWTGSTYVCNVPCQEVKKIVWRTNMMKVFSRAMRQKEDIEWIQIVKEIKNILFCKWYNPKHKRS